MPRLNVLFVVSECVPFAKTGGLADVAGALPIALAARGHDVRVVLPRYKVTKKYAQEQLPMSLPVPLGGGEAWCGVWTAPLVRGVRGSTEPGAAAGSARAYLLEHDRLYDRDGIYGDSHGDFGDNLARYALLSRGALRLAEQLEFFPDVVHVHDWQSSLVPVYLDTLERGNRISEAATVLTVHNLAYQGWFAKEHLWQTGLGWDLFHPGALEAHDSINLLKGGIRFATLVSTVSPRYAREIQTREGGEGLDGVLRERGSDLVGVLNGIDDDVWNPESDAHTVAAFDAQDLTGKAACKAALQREMGLSEREDVPLIGLVSRFAPQKGIDVVAEALEEILGLDVQFVVLGSGERWAERTFTEVSRRSDRFRAFIGMNEALAHRIEAGSDLFLMPSRYEPCGLNQMYSQRYGTLPIVRGVGGLDDTVDNEVTGFKFEEMSAAALAQAVAWAVYTYRERPDSFRAMQFHAMTKRMGWQHASRQYEALYRMAMARRRGRRITG